jgi:hypothetical protein
MPSVDTTPGRMEILARALDRAVASALVPRLRIDQLRSSFVAIDEQGQSWTLDPESHRWGRLHGERWMLEDPPQLLFMDSKLRASLEALEAMAARAVVKSADALYAPRACWFRTSDPSAEPPAMPVSIPSQQFLTPPQPPLDREQAPFADPEWSSESKTPRARTARKKRPARPATEDPFVEPVRMASVTSSEVSGPAKPTIRTMPASIPSQEFLAPPQPPLDREQAPFADAARSSESMTSRASSARKKRPARRATEDPFVEPVRMASVTSSEACGQAEPAACESVETTPDPESVPMLTVTPTRNSSMAGEPPPAVASRVAAQAATPVEKTAPSRPAIPAAHLRFAGPGFVAVPDDLATPALVAMAALDATASPDRLPASTNLPLPVRTRDASPRRERWVPPSIAPRLTSEHPEPGDDRIPVFLCALITALFLALASLKGDGRDYAGALVFGLLTGTLLFLNLVGSRQD